LTVAFLFISLAVFLLLEVPVAASLGLSAGLTLAFFNRSALLGIPSIIFANLTTPALLAIPYFIAAGIVLGRSGISGHLIGFAQMLVGRMRGGLAVVTVIVSIFLAGISGSGPADVAALGLVLIPAMTAAGYSKDFSAALMAACGGIGIIIPPSIALIIYALVADASPEKLFLAGVLPGVIVGAGLMVYVIISCRKTQQPSDAPRPSLREFISALRKAVWGLAAPALILGGIYSGLCTATEAAVVALAYAVAVERLIYRAMTWRQLFGCFRDAATTTGQILLIVAAAGVFSFVMGLLDAPQSSTLWLVGIGGGRIIFLILVNVLLLLAGCFLDAISIFYVIVPLLLPAAGHYGVDPVHFGVIITVNMAIGQVTPPVGVNLFTAAGISGVPVWDIAKRALPLVIVELAALGIVTFIPWLSLWLPSLLTGAAK